MASEQAAPFVIAAGAAVRQRHFHYLACGVACASGRCQKKVLPLGSGLNPPQRGREASTRDGQSAEGLRACFGFWANALCVARVTRSRRPTSVPTWRGVSRRVVDQETGPLRHLTAEGPLSAVLAHRCWHPGHQRVAATGVEYLIDQLLLAGTCRGIPYTRVCSCPPPVVFPLRGVRLVQCDHPDRGRW